MFASRFTSCRYHIASLLFAAALFALIGNASSFAVGQTTLRSNGAPGVFSNGEQSLRGDAQTRWQIVRLPQPDADDSIASPSDRPRVVSSEKWTDVESACDVPCCTLCPCVYANVDFLYLHRPAASGAVPLLVDANSGAPVLTGQDLSFGYQPGMRATIGLRCGDMGGVEFGYFGYFDNSATTSAAAANYPGMTLALPGALGGASNVFFGLTQIGYDYSSAINSYEINWTCCCCECLPGCCNGPPTGYSVEWLNGLRYVSLDEQLQINGARDEIGGTETGYYHVDARNDLYGVQTGLRGRACRGRWGAEATAKAGLFANQAGQSQYLIDYPNYPLRAPVGDNGTSMAFVGELGLTGIYQINRTWGLRAGYNLIWLQGVALAPSQLDYTFTPSSATSYVRNDGLFLHGFNFGVEARW